MASNLRRSKRTVGNQISDVASKVSSLQKRPNVRRVGTSTISNSNLAGDITADKITAGKINAGGVEIGNDVGPTAGHNGISLSSSDFNNIFLKRDDGVVFFRVNGTGANSLSFDSSSSILSVKGTINATSGTIGAFTIGTVDLVAGTIGTPYSGVTASISLGTNGEIKSRLDSSGIKGTFYTEVYMNKYDDQGGLNVQGTASGSFAQTRIRSSFISVGGIAYADEFQHNTTGGARFSGGGTHTNFGIGASTTGAFRTLNSSDVWSQAITSGRTVLINSAGTIGGVVSSIKFKEDIRDFDADCEKVLEIRPVTFLYKEEFCEPGATREREFGVIAEQVESIGGLENLLIYDDGVLNSFRYEKLPLYLLEVCKKQNKIIEDLERRIAELEGKD